VVGLACSIKPWQLSEESNVQPTVQASVFDDELTPPRVGARPGLGVGWITHVVGTADAVVAASNPSARTLMTRMVRIVPLHLANAALHMRIVTSRQERRA
jgi:hypothetical protein